MKLERGGGTAIAIASSNEDSVNGFLWGDGFTTGSLSETGAPKVVLRKYVELIRREPAAYISMKWDFTKKTLGLGSKIRCLGYEYNMLDGMAEYGFNDCMQRQFFVKLYNKVNEILGFYTCTPWFVYLISIILVSIKWIQKDEERKLYLFILCLAVFYYSAFIINTQSFELRYFYPSLWLMMLLDGAI